MPESPLQTLSDMTEAAHTRIQQAHEHINPVVAVRSGMRATGIPADVMTIDCLRTRRRIMLILHDEEPGQLLYQFITLEDEVPGAFERTSLSKTSPDTLVRWMQDYFG